MLDDHEITDDLGDLPAHKIQNTWQYFVMTCGYQVQLLLQLHSALTVFGVCMHSYSVQYCSRLASSVCTIALSICYIAMIALVSYKHYAYRVFSACMPSSSALL
jgi:hypothetical protein